MLYHGVAERWINIWLYKVYKNSSDNGDMSKKKENPKIIILLDKDLSPKAYGLR